VSPLSLYPYFFFHPTHIYIVRCLLLLLLDGHCSLLSCGILLLLLRIQVDCTRDLRPATNREEQGEKKKSFARPFYFSIENELDVESGAPKTVHHPPPKKKKKK
jgi:hypothetical protein